MKKFLSCLMALAMLLCTLTAYAADTNWDSGDGEDMGDAINLQNAWLVYTDGGKCVNAAEGLRVTVYDAESESKVYNTVDITGNKYISAVSSMRFFADSYNGSPELIPKTTWLQSKWIGATYEDVSSSAVAKFNNAVIGRIEYGGYSPQYIPELDELDIISENNTANLEKDATEALWKEIKQIFRSTRIVRFIRRLFQTIRRKLSADFFVKIRRSPKMTKRLIYLYPALLI